MRIIELIKEFWWLILIITFVLILGYLFTPTFSSSFSWVTCKNCTQFFMFIPIGLIVGLEGGLGSGKTIMVVRYLVKDFNNGIPIYTNFKMEKIDWNKLDVLEILKMDKEKINIQNLSLAIDEITVFMDCRTSLKKMNRLISYFILQTRKRNVTLYYTTQDFNMVDLRLTNHTDIRITCEKIRNPEGKFYKHWRKYTLYDLRDLKNFKYRSFKLKISKYYGYYDTNEVILPPLD